MVMFRNLDESSNLGTPSSNRIGGQTTRYERSTNAVHVFASRGVIDKTFRRSAENQKQNIRSQLG